MKSWLGLALLAVCGAALAAPSDSSLVDLAENGQTQQALTLIDRGSDVNAPSDDGTTALLWAVHRDDRALVARLLKAHADAKASNALRRHAHVGSGAVRGSDASSRLLLKAGADPNRRIRMADGVDDGGPHGQCAGRQAAAAARRARGCDRKVPRPDGTDLGGRREPAGRWCKLLIAAHARSECALDGRSRPAPGHRRTAYAGAPPGRPHAAAVRRAPGVPGVRAGPDRRPRRILNLADPEGITPLLIATENFHFDIAAYLMKAGADVNHWDWWGRTPLYAAVDLNTLALWRPRRSTLAG